jgi:tripartite-type tricarboxylate transporter receptor subunit TctC
MECGGESRRHCDRLSAPFPPLRLVLGFSPNSASHNVARAVAPSLARELGRPVELVLHPGDSGAAAARMVAALPPDGHTLLVATLGSHALVPAMNPGCGYHPLDDFTPISLLLTAPLILAVPASAGIANLAELIEAARNADAPLSYGTSAVAGAPHLAAALFAHRGGVRLRHARYGDTRDLYADLVSGRIALSFNNVMSMLPLIREGTLVPLGTTGRAPHPALPDVMPIAAGAGLDAQLDARLADYAVTNWLGVVGPSGLPAAAIAEVGAALTAAARGLATAGESDACACPPDTFAKLIRSEWQHWTPIVRALGWTT